MNTSELAQRIKSAGFYPIPVEGGANHNEAKDLTFSGTLEEFFDAAKALGATVVFLFVANLDDDDFHCDSDYNGEDGIDDSGDGEESTGESAASAERFDLTVVLPALADFRKYIGQECLYLLTAKSQLAALSFLLPESWWSSFEELQAEAIRKVDEDREAIREKMEAQRLKEEDSLLAKSRSLLDDPEFCRIPTQRGMRAYAIEKLPELEEVDNSRLTYEIQKLSDKVKARKRSR